MGAGDPGHNGLKPDRNNGMKVSDLSAVTGVSKQAIHFYLREGLLPPGEKTSQNMAYYDDSHVERIKLIKELQEKNRLKLSEIKELLSGDACSIENGAAVLDAFDFLPGEDLSLSAAELLKRSGLSTKDFDKLLDSGLIKPIAKGHAKKYGASSLELARLSKKILNAGYNVDYLIKVLHIYDDVSRELTVREIENFFKRPMAAADIAALSDTFRETEPYLEKAFWLMRRSAFDRQVDDIIGGFSLFSLMTGKELKDDAGTVLPSGKYLEPLDIPGKIDILRSMMKEGRMDAVSYITMALIYYMKRDKKEQLKWVKRALEDDPENKWALLLLGDAYVYSGAALEARETLSRCIGLYPDFALAHCLLAIAMLQSVIDEKRVERALALITGALSELEKSMEFPDPEGFENLILLSMRGKALMLMPDFIGSFREATSQLRKAVELGEKEKKAAKEPYYLATTEILLLNVYYDLGRAADKVEDFKGRDKYWNKLIAIDPDNSIVSHLEQKMK